MEKTRIEWADSSWNVISGCKNTCSYCYARGTANRFKGCDISPDGTPPGEIAYLTERLPVTDKRGVIRNAAYPFGFTPTFHEYRLDDPKTKGFGKNIFVCSMADMFGCYDEQTEVLTKEGWVFFRDLTMQHSVGYLDEETGELKYANPSTITKMPYKGLMYSVDTRSLDICVTPNHKMYVTSRPKTAEGRKSRKRGWKYRLTAAEDLFGTDYCCKRDFAWSGQEVDTFVIPDTDIKVPMDLWLKFLGYYVSEGSAFTTCGKNRVSMPQTKPGSDFYEVWGEIAKLCGNKLQMSDDRCIIQNVNLKNYLEKLGHSFEKSIPSEYKELSSRQLKILLLALIVGDGRVLKNLKTEAYSYYTTSKKLADDVQEIALKSGYVANITLRPPRPSRNYEGRKVNSNYTCYEVIITSKSRQPEVYSRRNVLRGGAQTEQYVPYDGTVYCCEVPSHILYVRRNGKACWCGNSWVPDEWIKKVFDSCKAAPGHRYLFLTKNPARYLELAEKGILESGDDFWYGTTVTDPEMQAFWSDDHNTFLSIEPILAPFDAPENDTIFKAANWVIFGAETGNRKDKVKPERKWVEPAVISLREHGIPVFMKDSMKPVWGEDIIKEFPWRK